MGRVLAALAIVLAAAPVWAAEVVVKEGGYRIDVPVGWEVVKKGDRVVLIDPDGTDKKGQLVRGGARLWLRPIDDVNRWFEELLNRDETRDVHRKPQSDDGGDATFEYIDELSRRDVGLRVSIVCRRVAEKSVCVVLEFRVDDPQPGRHRQVHAKIVDSLRPVSELAPRTPSDAKGAKAAP